ncbi:hypothetical protein M8J77_023078 [Diaphorina citri]|jgi:Chromosome segregation ATPases|nr:hypothetical protein M8J77_023078 [Diaphorina citri]
MANHLSEILDAVYCLEAVKNGVRTKNEDLTEAMDRMNDEFRELTAINNKLCRQLEESNEEIGALREEKCALEACMDRKEEEKSKLCKLLDKYEQLKKYEENLKEANAIGEKEMIDLQKTFHEVEKCPQEKEHFICRLEENLQEMKTKMCDYKNTVARLKSHKRCLKIATKECQDDLLKRTDEADALCSKVKQCESKKQNRPKQIAELQTRLKQIQEALQEQKENRETLEEEVKRFQDNNHKLKMDNMELEASVKDLARTLKSRCKTIEKSQQELDQLKEEYETYKQSIEKLRNQIVCNYTNSSCSGKVLNSFCDSASSESRNSHQHLNVGGCGDKPQTRTRNKMDQDEPICCPTQPDLENTMPANARKSKSVGVDAMRHGRGDHVKCIYSKLRGMLKN